MKAAQLKRKKKKRKTDELDLVPESSEDKQSDEFKQTKHDIPLVQLDKPKQKIPKESRTRPPPMENEEDYIDSTSKPSKEDTREIDTEEGSDDNSVKENVNRLGALGALGLDSDEDSDSSSLLAEKKPKKRREKG